MLLSLSVQMICFSQLFQIKFVQTLSCCDFNDDYFATQFVEVANKQYQP